MKIPLFTRFAAASAGLLTLLAATNSPGAPGDLYATGAAPNNVERFVFRFTPGGVRSTFGSGLYQPTAMAFDRKGNLFVGDSGSGIPPRDSLIVKFTPDGTRSTFASIGITQLLGMTFDGAGNLLVSTADKILKLAPDGTQSTFASGLDGAWALAFDKSGNLYVGAGRSILKFTSDGSRSTFITYSGPASSSTGLAFDAKGNLFVRYGSSILKVTPAGTSTTVATGSFHYPLAFDGTGNLFACLHAFSEGEPSIVKFALDGSQTTFASAPPISPAALAFEPLTEKLRNLSARGLVGGGDDVLMIGGFIVGGSPLANNAIVLRALGPSLAGVANALADPILELRDASGAIVASNDNWRDTQEAQIVASGLAPGNGSESAIYSTLPQGSYTAIVRGTRGTTGTALVEVYSISQ